jgi:hypothetical protein
LQISLPEKPRELRLWLIDQVTILAEAKGEELTEQRLRIYVEDLFDLTRSQLEPAFLRARRELKFFPQISELRELAGVKPEDEQDVEADAAWNYALDYLRKWGVDRLPLYSGGKRIDAPPLPARLDYALRQIGGLWALNQITSESRAFVKKDFAKAYSQAPIAEQLGHRLSEAFGDKKLLGQVRQLVGAKQLPVQKSPMPAKPGPSASSVRKVPSPPTDAEINDRREMLRQQTAALSKREIA